MTARLLVAIVLATVAAAPASAKTVTVTGGDDGDTVPVHRGDTIRVSLAANSSTPFAWDVSRRPERAVARIVDDRYVSPADAPPGAPGRQVYVLRATGPGTTPFRTAYRSLDDSRAVRRFGIVIRVRR